MLSWKNLKRNPPYESCNMVLKRSRYELAYYEAGNKRIRFPDLTYSYLGNLPDDTLYINLDEIK